MKLNSFRYIAPQAFKSMKRNGWLTFAAIMTITISLFLCVFFYMIITNLDANATELEQDVRVMVYIDKSVPKVDYAEIEQQLGWIDGVAHMEFVAKEDAISDLGNRFDQIDLEATVGGENPLPDMYSITAADKSYVKQIADEAAKIEGIVNVRYGEGTVEKLFSVTDALRKAGIAVMILLAVAAVVLIAMTTKLTILGRKKEIMVMKWCGATDAFVRWPFFLEGLILGFVGSLLALVLALLLYNQVTQYVASYISFITILPLSSIWGTTTLFTLGAGLVLGAVGSLIPLSRFLKV